MQRQRWVSQRFQEQFGSAPAVVCHAPGRVNLIGDHTDYNDGFVLPAAINYGTDIAASPRNDNTVRVFANECDSALFEVDLDSLLFSQKPMWANYIKGTLLVLQQAGYTFGGADMLVSGNIPQGAGLSSSASFEVAILKTMAKLYSLALNGTQAAQLGQKAENDFVGCSCGIMDQLISALGQAGHAMLLDCRSLTFEDAPIPEGYALFIVNSNVKRGLVDSAYNTRREQCEQVAAIAGKPALRDVSLAQLQSLRDQIPDELYRRARHVITENQRTCDALDAMKAADMPTLSRLMRESHMSLKNDFEVTTKEMDGLVDIIHEQIGTTGGVRMTGGGFGGCVVAIVPDEAVDSLKAHVSEAYPREFGLKPDIYICLPSQGAFRERVA